MNILITGASRGIGFETAKILSKNHRVLAVSRDFSSLKKLKFQYPEIEILQFDITKKADFLKLKKVVAEKFSPLDVLLNNAGFLVNKSFEKISEKDIQNVFHVNFFGAFELIKTLYPYMKRKSKSNKANSHIVNIGSMGGYQGSSKFKGLSIYSSSKAALACLSECLAEEFKESKIAVNCLALGSVQTEMLARAFPGYSAPLTPSMMGEFIADFAVSGHKYFNGKVLPVSFSSP